MNRRFFIKSIAASSLVASTGMPKLFAANNDYQGKLLITLRANGGWDTTAFCDPKENVPGERVITHWSENLQTQRAGNIPYAPFANNQSFFEKHYQKMLVINGINGKTNSHKTGRQRMNTGSTSTPSISGLFAAVHGHHLTLPWLVDSFDKTFDKKILVRTKVSGDNSISALANPNQSSLTDTKVAIHNEDLSLVREFVQNDIAEKLTHSNLLPREISWRQHFSKASANDPKLLTLADTLGNIEMGDYSNSSLNKQISLVLSSFKAGLSLSADIATGGFDTHNRSDERQTGHLNNLIEGADFIWFLAEQLGLDDRLIVQIESDFGRTPHYNKNDGKDHWSVGSKVIMEKNQQYTNRVIGGTDEGLKAKYFDSSTLQESESGIQLEPKHIAYALWEHLGLTNASLTRQFDLNVPLLPIFS